MYLPVYTLMIVVSLVVSVAAFFWGLSDGQFSNADRARYLPFTGKEPGPAATVGPDARLPLEIYFLGAVVLIGLLIFTAPVLLMLYHMILR